MRTASVVVTLPERAARAAGMRLLSDNSGWVRAKLAAPSPDIGIRRRRLRAGGGRAASDPP